MARKPAKKPDKSDARPERVKYRKLGNTELNISLMGFGASPLGDVFGTTDPAEGKRAVHKAIDEGINFFDVSPYYGLTLAEARLGAALDGKRKDVILATKCGRDGVDRFDFSSRRVNDSIGESLKRLRTDYVDLLQAHDVEFGHVEQVIHETIPAMRRLQAQGKARFIGISGYPLKTLVKIAESVPVDSVLTYCRYNLLNNELDAVLMPAAKRLGIGVINASPLHMGILTKDAPPEWHPAPQLVRDAGKQAADYCSLHGIDLTEVALGYCLDHPLVASTLVGMSTRRHVSENLRALTTPMDRQLLEQVRLILAPVFNYVWPSGRLENND
jgi:L-galactose dehydrogenase